MPLTQQTLAEILVHLEYIRGDIAALSTRMDEQAKAGVASQATVNTLRAEIDTAKAVALATANSAQRWARAGIAIATFVAPAATAYLVSHKLL